MNSVTHFEIYGDETPSLATFYSKVFGWEIEQMPGIADWLHNALKAGATFEEVMEILKLCVAQGVQACNLAVPILAEELARK